MIPQAYFAYGSNLNPERVRERGLKVVSAQGAIVRGSGLRFNKAAKAHPGEGHANIIYAATEIVQGVFYELADVAEIEKMDHFERTPINYSREVVVAEVAGCAQRCWTYFANPAVLRDGLRPSQEYLNHLLAGHQFLSADYFARLAATPVANV